MEISRKYGVSNTVVLPLISYGTVDFNTNPITLASGDVQLRTNTGAFASPTNLPVYAGRGLYSLTLTAAEMRGSSIDISFICASGTKLFTDTAVLIKTYGGGISSWYPTDPETVNDQYYADIQMNIDNAGGKDEYSVTWYKNSAPISAGITSPQLQVIKRADGTNLIQPTGMTEIGSIHSFKYDSSADRITRGESYVSKVTATIDGASREWRKIIGRDQ